MALAAEASRRFMARLNSLLDKAVAVTLADGRVYRGRLGGFDPSTMNLVIERAVDEEGREYPLVLIAGSSLREIALEEESVFDAKEFAEFLVKRGGIGGHLVKVHEDINVVEVARSVRVTGRGVEGAGALAQRIHTLFNEYLRQKGVRV